MYHKHQIILGMFLILWKDMIVQILGMCNHQISKIIPILNLAAKSMQNNKREMKKWK